MRLIKSLIIVIAIFTAFLPNYSEAASIESAGFAKCAMPTFERAVADSKTIFSGKVLSVRTEGDQKIFKFRVEKYWKSKVSKTVEVRYYETIRYQAWLEVGKHYLVYAKVNDDGTLFDGRCSWTKNYSEAKPDLKKLGKGKSAR